MLDSWDDLLWVTWLSDRTMRSSYIWLPANIYSIWNVFSTWNFLKSAQICYANRSKLERNLVNVCSYRGEMRSILYYSWCRNFSHYSYIPHYLWSVKSRVSIEYSNSCTLQFMPFRPERTILFEKYRNINTTQWRLEDTRKRIQKWTLYVKGKAKEMKEFTFILGQLTFTMLGYCMLNYIPKCAPAGTTRAHVCVPYIFAYRSHLHISRTPNLAPDIRDGC